MNLPQDRIDRIKTWYYVVEDEFEKLSDWEQQFIESTKDQFDRTQFLTEKQIETLHKLYNKVV